VADQQFAGAVENLTAFGRRHQSPALESGAGSGDGGINIGLFGEGKVAQ